MINHLIIDFASIEQEKPAQKAKALLIEHMVKHPDTVITIMGADNSLTLNYIKETLRKHQFPFDTVIISPLKIQPISFKTMFAVRLQEEADARVVLVIDQDIESREMWKNGGAKYTFSPEAEIRNQ